MPPSNWSALGRKFDRTADAGANATYDILSGDTLFEFAAGQDALRNYVLEHWEAAKNLSREELDIRIAQVIASYNGLDTLPQTLFESGANRPGHISELRTPPFDPRVIRALEATRDITALADNAQAAVTERQIAAAYPEASASYIATKDTLGVALSAPLVAPIDAAKAAAVITTGADFYVDVAEFRARANLLPANRRGEFDTYLNNVLAAPDEAAARAVPVPQNLPTSLTPEALTASALDVRTSRAAFTAALGASGVSEITPAIAENIAVATRTRAEAAVGNSTILPATITAESVRTDLRAVMDAAVPGANIGTRMDTAAVDPAINTNITTMIDDANRDLTRPAPAPSPPAHVNSPASSFNVVLRGNDKPNFDEFVRLNFQAPGGDVTLNNTEFNTAIRGEAGAHMTRFLGDVRHALTQKLGHAPTQEQLYNAAAFILAVENGEDRTNDNVRRGTIHLPSTTEILRATGVLFEGQQVLVQAPTGVDEGIRYRGGEEITSAEQHDLQPSLKRALEEGGVGRSGDRGMRF